MAVKTYSLKKDGNVQLSKNFKVREFACSGYDEVKVDTGLVEILQTIRDFFGKPVTITSSYRPPAYNATIKTASKTSKHMLGRAADIKISGISPITVALYAQSIGAGGIGCYTYEGAGFTHIDTRASDTDKSIYRGLYTNRSQSQYTSCGAKFFPVVKRGSKNYVVLLLQRLLKQSGHYSGSIDSSYGTGTENAVKAFQKANKLTIDGSCGNQTWQALLKHLKLWY